MEFDFQFAHYRVKTTDNSQQRVHPEMVDFGSGQGRSDVETGGVAALRRGYQQSENAGLGQKMPFMDGHGLCLA
jgi:hypothetical protein